MSIINHQFNKSSTHLFETQLPFEICSVTSARGLLQLFSFRNILGIAMLRVVSVHTENNVETNLHIFMESIRLTNTQETCEKSVGDTHSTRCQQNLHRERSNTDVRKTVKED